MREVTIVYGRRDGCKRELMFVGWLAKGFNVGGLWEKNKGG